MSGEAGQLPTPISGEESRAYTLQAVPPTPFGKYTLIGRLGSGGMADVNLAIVGGKGGFRKLFVIKRLHPHLEMQEGFVAMFLDEARLAAQLNHPHCVQTVEVGDVDGQHFLAMEYLDGQGLERLLRSASTTDELIPIGVGVRCIADALDGLAYAHELTDYEGNRLSVVHRDVSPQNLFVTYNGVVKLLDFGIAKAASNVVETRTGVVKGKYAYIAPEQALGHKVDSRADIWSMGVVLWEVLTARRLFKSSSELATLQETLRGEVLPPSSSRPEIPPELDEIVLRALTRDVDSRYQTAAEFKEALEMWLSTQGAVPTRRTVAQLMQARFSEVIKIHQEKLSACIAAAGEDAAFIHQSNMSSSSGALVSQSGQQLSSSSSGVSIPVSRAHEGVTPTPGAVPNSTPSHPGAFVGAPSLTPSAQEDDSSRRGLAWKLVLFALLILIAVLLALFLPRAGGPIDDGTDDAVLALAGSSGGVAPGALPPLPPPSASGTAGSDTAGSGTAGSDTAASGTTPPSTDPPTTPSPSTPELPSATGAATGTPDEPSAHERRPTSGRTSRGGGGRREPRETPAPRETPTPREGSESARTSEEPAPASGPGFLSLVTSPWTTVYLGGRSLGDTPLVRVELPAGRHTLRLVNPEQDLTESYVVEIRPGETTTRRLGLR